MPIQRMGIGLKVIYVTFVYNDNIPYSLLTGLATFYTNSSNKIVITNKHRISSTTCVCVVNEINKHWLLHIMSGSDNFSLMV